MSVFQAQFGSFALNSAAAVSPTNFIRNSLDATASVDDWMKSSGLDFEYLSSPIRYQVPGDYDTLRYDKTKVIFRSDNHHPICHMSDKFQPTQPRDVVEMYHRICKSNDFQMDKLGCLKGGKAIWGLAKTSLSGSTMGQDRQQAYVLLHTPNDGTGSFIIKLINKSLACDNMLNATLQGANDFDALPYLYKIPHSTSVNFKQITRELEKLPEYYQSFLNSIDELANTPIHKEDMVKYFISLYGDKYDEVSSATEKHVHKLIQTNISGPGQNLRARQGSVYGALSAVTHYYDHVVNSKKSHLASASENRFSSSTFGVGENIKNKAYRLALDMIA